MPCIQGFKSMLIAFLIAFFDCGNVSINIDKNDNRNQLDCALIAV